MSIRKYGFAIIIIIAVILVFLNIKKYREMNDVVIPVWSSYDEEYYHENDKTVMEKLRDTFSPDRIIYGITRVRLRAPITYLKKEIPLLAYYTPEELQQQTETIYKPESNSNGVIRLKFRVDERSPLLVENNQNTINDRENTGNSGEQESGVNIRQQGKPLIAIYHTHTSETYMDDPRNQDSNGHVLPGNIGNVGKVGIELARVLADKYGFRVIHTTKIHDENYNKSYYNSRNTLKNMLKINPEISLVLDIHRDGIRASVSKNDITTVIDQKRVANVMIVVGNGKYNYGEESNSSYSWDENLKMANNLAAKMNEMYPGLLRRVEIRDTTSNRYNQDLSPHALLIEIGDYRNTTQEALEAARYVAEVIGEMY